MTQTNEMTETIDNYLRAYGEPDTDLRIALIEQTFAADGSVTLAGMDVAVVDGDCKLTRVAGFFGDLPGLDA